MATRLAHISDLHYYRPPGIRQALTKRALGLANLYLKGRVSHFSEDVAALTVQSILEEAPDGVAITGDLTALAAPKEFDAALAGLKPLLDTFPTFIIPGNHDYYTRGARREARIEASFGQWILGESQSPEGAIIYPTRHRLGPVTLYGLNPCRPDLSSSGLLLPQELERLEMMLAQPRAQGESRIIMIHYPILNMNGEVVTKWSRRLNGRDGLIDILKAHPVDMVIHGHDHLRYHNRLEVPGGSIHIANSGSAAFTLRDECPIPASYNLYEFEDGALTRVTHKDLTDDGYITTYDGPPPPSGPTYNRDGYGDMEGVAGVAY